MDHSRGKWKENAFLLIRGDSKNVAICKAFFVPAMGHLLFFFLQKLMLMPRDIRL